MTKQTELGELIWRAKLDGKSEIVLPIDSAQEIVEDYVGSAITDESRQTISELRTELRLAHNEKEALKAKLRSSF